MAVSVLACVFGGSMVLAGQQGKTLHGAAATGDVAQLKQYIENKADLNAADDNGNVPIKLAVEACNLNCVKLLLEAGANPNTKDSTGSTPLMIACMLGQKDIVDSLLAAKADHSERNATGLTALHWAAMMGQLGIVESLVTAGADVNARDNAGQTPLVLAERRGSAEVVQLLQHHGASTLSAADPYGVYGANPQGGPGAGAMSGRPADFVIDANVIAAQLQKMPALEAPLKVIDANSQSEQRAWIGRRSDNRTMLLRAVQKQFEDEMAFVRKVAVEEKAVKTTKAVDDLVAARKKRYEEIGTELRDQIRQNRVESRDTMTTTTTGRGGRGGTTGRSTRGRGAGGAAGTDSYATAAQPRTSRRAAAEPNEAPLDVTMQAQIQAWTSTTVEDKTALLQATSDLDVTEYAVLSESAKSEKAAKTELAIMALLMLREERIAGIREKWIEDDERTQRMQERAASNGTQGTQQGTQRGSRRGGR
jgi:hypothetical protein